MSLATPVSDYIIGQVDRAIDRHRAVVWYDPGAPLSSLFEQISRPDLIKVDARASVLQARKQADAAWLRVAHADARPPHGPVLLIYVPWRQARDDDDRKDEPFEGFARLGTSFGTDASETLDSLARKALPGKATEVDRLFGSGARPSLAQLDALGDAGGFPLLKQRLSTDDPVEVAVAVLGRWEQVSAALPAAGVQDELHRLLQGSLGFTPPAARGDLRELLARWVLYSEFALDLGGEVPAHVVSVPRAPEPARVAVFAICDRLRKDERLRDTYLLLAREVEGRLALGGLGKEARLLGARDTFACEDEARLRFVIASALAGELGEAREALDARRDSVWRHVEDHNQRWTLAGFALEALEIAGRWASRALDARRQVRDHISAYVEEQDGLWRLDRAHRRLERAVGDCLDRGPTEPLIEHTRKVWRDTTERAQRAFLDAVAHDGWPPDFALQTSTWARHIVPQLKSGQRVAYYLVDAMRFEMGQDLGEMLRTLGSVEVSAAATVLPTTTPFGMAALLPGAESGLGCVVEGAELTPTVGGTSVRDVDGRMALFTRILGDRVRAIRLDELVELQDLRPLLSRIELLVVRSDDIDKAGEGTNLPSARKFINSVLDDLMRVAVRLSRAGVTHHVFASDHGFVLMPGLPAGDVVRSPEGQWVLSKRRTRIGAVVGSSEGVRVIPAARLGLHGPVADVVVPVGFKAFKDGSSYFHEGISLQECVIPVVTLHARGTGGQRADAPQVEISYRADRFTSRVISVKVKMATLLPPEVDLRLVAVDPTNEQLVGRAVDSEHRDPATGLIRLRARTELSVAMRINDDFVGAELEIRAMEGSGTGMILGRRRLRNDCQE